MEAVEVVAWIIIAGLVLLYLHVREQDLLERYGQTGTAVWNGALLIAVAIWFKKRK
jgi:TRAP-type uncharacterized transport system fused permease subunit